VDVGELDDGDRPWLRALVDREWGLPAVSISGAHDPSELPGLVAYEGEDRLGALTYRIEHDTCEVVTINALIEGRGVGATLLTAARAIADERGLRLWLITMNDNIRAIDFYQRQGMDLIALHRNFVDVVRQYKPTVGDKTPNGIPLRHALEFSY